MSGAYLNLTPLIVWATRGYMQLLRLELHANDRWIEILYLWACIITIPLCEMFWARRYVTIRS